MKKTTTSSRWRVALASAASAAVLVVAPLAAAQTVHAQPYPPASTLTLSSTTVTAGGLLTFSTSPVFAAGALVTALLESNPVVLGRFRADANGSVSGTVTIPRRTITGYHVFRLTSDHPDPSIGATIWVEGGVSPTPSPTPTHTHKPTPSPTPTHTHKPTPPGSPGHPGGPDDRTGALGSVGRSQDDGRDASVDPATQPRHASLAETGSAKALTVGGTTAALLVMGSGTMLAVRRRRNS